MRTRQIRYLFSSAIISALAACSSGSAPSSTVEQSSTLLDTAEVRQTLSAKLAAGHQPQAYRVAWDVLAQGASVSPTQMRLFYSRRVVDRSDRASGDDQNEVDYWNREHLWPQSAGLAGTPASNDLHNLVPVDRTINSSRGNKWFDDADTPHHECVTCRASGSSWDPGPEVRGDVARALFYMDVRYEGARRDGVPNLVLTDVADSRAGRFGRLSTLLDWHCSDPVSDEERRRHASVVNVQGNRNAFIDQPDWVRQIYGVECPPR